MFKSKKEDSFFALFREATEVVYVAAQKLEEIMQQNNVTSLDAEKMDEIEHKADQVTDEILDKLNATFITPLDREDIYTLAQVIDDIVDQTQGAVERMTLYKTKKPSPAALELAHTYVRAAEQLRIAFSGLNNINSKKNEILAAVQEIYKLESQGDSLYRQQVAHLFEYEKDPIEIIKWKEILEHLEDTLDYCERVADLLRGVVLKYD